MSVRSVLHRLARPALAGLVGLVAFWALVPVVSFDDPLSTVLLDRDGRLLGASLAGDGQWRFGASDAVPEKFVAAITTFEDRRFFRHPGVDVLALGRAALVNLRSGRVVSGGSTLPMQVVRLARKGRARTFSEKAIEIVLALRLSLSVSKPDVLRLYAAYAPFGGNTVGLDTAAWRYYGRDAGSLSWAETATLAVLPNAPSLVHPGRGREALLAKRNRLLDALHERGHLDALSAQLAKQEPLPPRPQPLPLLAPHLLSRVQLGRQLRWAAGDASPWVRSTLSRELQLRSEAVLRRHRRGLVDNGVHNAAALILDVESGRVLAYVGNLWQAEQAAHGEHVDVIPAPRSTGSLLKPLLFASLLDAGEVLPGQLIADVPTHIGSFNPENFDRSYAGAVPAEQALARSLNVPAVRMLRAHGVDRFAGLLRRVGVTTLVRSAREYGLALILGGAEASLWDMTGVYAGLARTVLAGDDPRPGLFHPPRYLEGEIASRPDKTAAPLDPGACYLTLTAMLEVERPGDELAWRAFSGGRRIAWKTGTSYGFRDAWAIGVTPRHAVGVWVGNASGEGRPGLTGYSAASPILFEIFDALPRDGWFEQPWDALVDIDVCARSGMRLGPHCQQRRSRLVPRAGLQTPPCGFCRLVHTDAAQSWQVHSQCEPVVSIRSASWFVLPPALETFYRRRHADYRPPPPLRADCRSASGAAGSRALSCVYPRENARVYVPIELDGAQGKVVLEAAHRDPETRVFWHLDDEYLGETRDIHQMALAPPAGRHVLTLVDERGESVRRSFEVIRR